MARHARFARFGSGGLVAVLVTAGLAVVSSAPTVAGAASGSASCFPSLEQFLTKPGDFTASTSGSGVADVVIEGATPFAGEGTGRLAWSDREVVTGNTSSPGGSMSGTLSLAVTLGGHSIAFTSSCTLESGVFTGETESDPFGAESDHTVLKGVEGEWIGTASNFPAAGETSKVVASLAVWTTDAGPRFHLDMQTATFTPGKCPDESNPTASVSVGGPTAANASVTVSAPLLQAGRGECVGQQQQQEPG